MSPMVRRPLGMELALLGFFRQGPVHGYQLHQMLSDPDGLGSVWRLKQSQLYAFLSKLEQDGYIHGEVEPQEPARPPRKIFQLTTMGQAAYEDWLKRPVKAHYLMRQEFMAKIYFARKEGQELGGLLIDAQRAACQKWLESLSSEAVEQGSFKWLLRQYRIGQIQAEIAWLDNDLKDF